MVVPCGRRHPVQREGVPPRGGGRGGTPWVPVTSSDRCSPGHPRRDAAHSPPLPPPPPPAPGWATAMDRLLACRLPVPAATFTPMLPLAPLNAEPDRLALLYAAATTVL